MVIRPHMHSQIEFHVSSYNVISLHMHSQIELHVSSYLLYLYIMRVKQMHTHRCTIQACKLAIPTEHNICVMLKFMHNHLSHKMVACIAFLDTCMHEKCARTYTSCTFGLTSFRTHCKHLHAAYAIISVCTFSMFIHRVRRMP